MEHEVDVIYEADENPNNSPVRIGNKPGKLAASAEPAEFTEKFKVMQNVMREFKTVKSRYKSISAHAAPEKDKCMHTHHDIPMLVRCGDDPNIVQCAVCGETFVLTCDSIDEDIAHITNVCNTMASMSVFFDDNGPVNKDIDIMVKEMPHILEFYKAYESISQFTKSQCAEILKASAGICKEI